MRSFILLLLASWSFSGLWAAEVTLFTSVKKQHFAMKLKVVHCDPGVKGRGNTGTQGEAVHTNSDNANAKCIYYVQDAWNRSVCGFYFYPNRSAQNRSDSIRLATRAESRYSGTRDFIACSVHHFSRHHARVYVKDYDVPKAEGCWTQQDGRFGVRITSNDKCGYAGWWDKGQLCNYCNSHSGNFKVYYNRKGGNSLPELRNKGYSCRYYKKEFCS